MKQTLIWFNLQRYETGNRLSNIKDTFAESLQLQMSVLHKSMCIFKAGFSSSYYGCANYKEKVPNVSDPNQNVETTCNSKHKFIHQKGAEKLVKVKMNLCICIYTAILKNIRIFSGRYHFRLSVFASTGEYFHY